MSTREICSIIDMFIDFTNMPPSYDVGIYRIKTIVKSIYDGYEINWETTK